jgi:hypothetical protein
MNYVYGFSLKANDSVSIIERRDFIWTCMLPCLSALLWSSVIVQQRLFLT